MTFIVILSIFYVRKCKFKNNELTIIRKLCWRVGQRGHKKWHLHHLIGIANIESNYRLLRYGNWRWRLAGKHFIISEFDLLRSNLIVRSLKEIGAQRGVKYIRIDLYLIWYEHMVPWDDVLLLIVFHFAVKCYETSLAALQVDQDISWHQSYFRFFMNTHIFLDWQVVGYR